MNKWLRVLAAVIILISVGLVSMVRLDVPVEKLIPKYTDEHSRFITIDGMPVHYRDEGQGMPLVLLHGTPSSLQDWDGWAKELSGSFRVLRMDLPGFGLTGPNPSGDYTMRSYVEFLDKFLDAIQVKDCYLAGNSYGGRVAIEYAFEHRSRVRKLVLLDAAGYAVLGELTEEKFARTAPGRFLFRYTTPRFMVADGLKQMFKHNSAMVSPALVDRCYDMLRRTGNREAFIKVNGIPLGDASDHLRALSVPTLILWGREDAIFPVEHALRLEQDIAGSRTIIYDGIGHAPQMEIPERSAKDTAQFLADRPE